MREHQHLETRVSSKSERNHSPRIFRIHHQHFFCGLVVHIELRKCGWRRTQHCRMSVKARFLGTCLQQYRCTLILRGREHVKRNSGGKALTESNH